MSPFSLNAHRCNRHRSSSATTANPMEDPQTSSRPARGPTPVTAQKAACTGSAVRHFSLSAVKLARRNRNCCRARGMHTLGCIAASPLRHDLGRGLARAAPLGDHGAASLLLLLLALGVQAEKGAAKRASWGGGSGFVCCLQGGAKSHLEPFFFVLAHRIESNRKKISSHKAHIQIHPCSRETCVSHLNG